MSLENKCSICSRRQARKMYKTYLQVVEDVVAAASELWHLAIRTAAGVARFVLMHVFTDAFDDDAWYC